MHVPRQKADDYVLQGHIDSDLAERILLHIDAERGRRERIVNDMDVGDGQGSITDRTRGAEKLTRTQLVAELEDREAKMRSGVADGAVTDQWRVYQFIIEQLSSDRPLRLMVQASAGTGKSYLTAHGRKKPPHYHRLEGAHRPQSSSSAHRCHIPSTG